MLIDDSAIAIEDDDQVVSICARKIGANFLIDPVNVALRDPLERLIPQGNAFLLVERLEYNAVELFFDDTGFDPQRGGIHGNGRPDCGQDHRSRQRGEDGGNPRRQLAISLKRSCGIPNLSSNFQGTPPPRQKERRQGLGFLKERLLNFSTLAAGCLGPETALG